MEIEKLEESDAGIPVNGGKSESTRAHLALSPSRSLACSDSLMAGPHELTLRGRGGLTVRSRKTWSGNFEGNPHHRTAGERTSKVRIEKREIRVKAWRGQRTSHNDWIVSKVDLVLTLQRESRSPLIEWSTFPPPAPPTLPHQLIYSTCRSIHQRNKVGRPIDHQISEQSSG